MIPLDSDKNLKNILKDYLKTSTSKWEKPCLSCNLTCNHTKDIKFNILNEILIICLQRINKFLNKKNLSIITFEEVLDMAEFLRWNYK